jgi:Arc/MetJ family transcription regulator
MTAIDELAATRAEALFVSPLSATTRPDRHQVEVAVRDAVRVHGGRGCAAEMAAEYGEHPDDAVRRMRWARAVVAEVYDCPPNTALAA